MTNNLIFLISQPRSGSTMLQAILGGHPEIHTCSEPWIALPHIYALREGGVEYDFNAEWCRVGTNAFFEEGGIDSSFYYESLNLFLTSLYDKALSNSGKTIFLDKTPRYYEICSDLIKVFPGAKFIVLYRNPLAVLNSILNTWVNDDIELLFNYARDLFIAPQKMADFVAEQKNNIHLVKYENIVSSPESELEKICRFIGVNYVNDMSNYSSEMKWLYGDKKFKNKKAPDIKSIDEWKTNLDNKAFVNFSSYYLSELGEGLVNTLGYDYPSLLECINNQSPDDSNYDYWEVLRDSCKVQSIEEKKSVAFKDFRKNRYQKAYEKLLNRILK